MSWSRQDSDDPADFDRRLYLVRKQFERSALPGYVVSISSSHHHLQGALRRPPAAAVLSRSCRPGFQTPFAVFHQRYATNVLPSWDRAQPCRTLAHNGEINTIWGNRSRMDARAATLPLDLHPVLTVGGSDSTSLDEVVELLSQNGRTVAEALRMLVPPANHGNKSSFPAIHRRLRRAVGWPRRALLCRWPPGRRHSRPQRSAPLPLSPSMKTAWSSLALKPASSTWIPSVSFTPAVSARAR
jgi:glutamate synthase domain-containing protein 1